MGEERGNLRSTYDLDYTFRTPTELACFLAAFHHVHRQLAVAVLLVTGTFVVIGPTFSLEALTAIAFVCTLPRLRKERGR